MSGAPSVIDARRAGCRQLSRHEAESGAIDPENWMNPRYDANIFRLVMI
jgi:hypothetical protein